MQPSTHMHGWVTPRVDGKVAKCGGPASCPDCRAEYRAAHGREWTAVDRTATRLGVNARARRKP